MRTRFESLNGFVKTIQNYIQMNIWHRDICVVEIRRINSCQGTVALLHLHGAGRVNLQLRMQHTPPSQHSLESCACLLAMFIEAVLSYIIICNIRLHEWLWASLVRRQLFSKSLNCTCPFSSLTTLEDFLSCCQHLHV